MPIAVGDLVQSQTTISVVPSTTLTEALNVMIEHDFSQLPILDKKRRPIGVVTTTSIARALLRFGARVEELSVSDATVRIPDYPVEEDLLYILDNILQHSAVFIVDESKALVGILTEYDTTQYFRQRAEDIVLVEDIESALKDHLLYAYEANTEESPELREAINNLSNSWDGIRKKTDSCLRAYAKLKEVAVVKADIDFQVNKYFPKPSDNKSFDSLTLSEFIQLAQKNWHKFEPVFNITSGAWTKMIDEVREIRNKLVHFRGDISPVERHSLRFCAEWFKAHPVSQADVILEKTGDAKIEIQQAPVPSEIIIHPTSLNKEAIDKVLQVKYAGLVNHLASLKQTVNFNLHLHEIESLVVGHLPQAARTQTAWWTDDSAHADQWLKTGWRAIRLQFGVTNPYVVFNNWSHTIHAIQESWQFAFWCKKLGCTEQELKDAIKTVGPESDLVEIHIKEELRKRKLLNV